MEAIQSTWTKEERNIAPIHYCQAQRNVNKKYLLSSSDWYNQVLIMVFQFLKSWLLPIDTATNSKKGQKSA